MIKSKRFLTLLICVVVYIIGLLNGAEPVALGTGLTILTAPYLTAETIRKS